MKDDLISRRAIFHELLVYGGKVCPNNDVDGFPITIKVCDIKEAIRNVPSADVRPERHGHWDDSDGEHIKCSKCGQFAPIVPQYQDEPITYEAPFCPNCGAKMDGKDVTQ